MLMCAQVKVFGQTVQIGEVRPHPTSATYRVHCIKIVTGCCSESPNTSFKI